MANVRCLHDNFNVCTFRTRQCHYRFSSLPPLVHFHAIIQPHPCTLHLRSHSLILSTNPSTHFLSRNLVSCRRVLRRPSKMETQHSHRWIVRLYYSFFHSLFFACICIGETHALLALDSRSHTLPTTTTTELSSWQLHTCFQSPLNWNNDMPYLHDLFPRSDGRPRAFHHHHRSKNTSLYLFL